MAAAEIWSLASEWEDESTDGDQEHYLLSMVGDVAVIRVNGSLINGRVSWWEYRWATGYGDIIDAITCAINNRAKQTVLYINSPGGQESGLFACADFISETASKLTELYAYTDTICLSAGLVIGSAVGRNKFYSLGLGKVGSIGSYAVITEYTEADKMMGIKRRVFRSNPGKGYGNPYEKLSPNLATLIEADVSRTGSTFNQHLSRHLNVPLATVATQWATGEVWYGDAAKEMGLVSKTISFNNLLIDLQSKVTQNNRVNTVTPQGIGLIHQSEDSPMAKATPQINPEAAQALAQQAAAQLLLQQSEGGEQQPSGAPATTTQDTQASGESASGAVTLEQVQEQLAQFQTQVTELTGQLTDKTTQLNEASAALLAANSELEKTKSSLSLASASEEALRGVVIESIQWTMAANGGTALDHEVLTSLATPLLLKQHTDAKTCLLKKFGAGGQHSRTEEDDDDTKLAGAAAAVNQNVLLPLSRFRSA